MCFSTKSLRSAAVAAASSPAYFETLGGFPFTLTSSDGSNLSACFWEARGGAASRRAVVLWCHGYAEHVARVAPICQVITAQNCACVAVSFRGHGLSDGRRGHVDKYEEYLCDVDAAVAAIPRILPPPLPPAVPFLLCGHSNGGLIATRWAQTRPAPPIRPAAVFLSSPFFGLAGHGAEANFLPLLAAVAPKARLKSPPELANGLSSLPEVGAAYRADPFVFPHFTLGYIAQAIRSQRALLRAPFPYPVSCVVGSADPIVSPAAVAAGMRAFGAEARLEVVAGGLHELFNEAEPMRFRAYAALTAAIDSVAPRS